ncbi:MAG: hypothetical protein P1V20_11385 [Verrucomicrobiales bacterium]|nr:hypothetical protein [Verrucomicrobiales bacterium]
MKSKYLMLLMLLIALWAAFLLIFGIRYMLSTSGQRLDTKAAREVATSVTSYHVIKGHFPASGPEEYDIDLETDARFMRMLSATTSFSLEGRSDIKDGALVDQRGKTYRVRIDTDDDGEVHCPITNEPIPGKVLVWSAGKDKLFETWSDNGKSW